MAAGNREVIASTIFKPVLAGPVLLASMRNLRGIANRLVPTRVGPGHYQVQLPAGDVDELLTSVTSQAESANGPRVVNTKLTRGGGNVLVDIYLNQVNPALGGLGGGGGGGFTEYGEIYAMMPGDNPATVALDFPVEFPSLGVTAGGVIGVVGSPSPGGVTNALVLPTAGDWQIDWQVSVDEGAGGAQLELYIQPGGIGPFFKIPESDVGRATGTTQIVGSKLITTLVNNSRLQVRNPSGNAVALTITPNAGGAAANPVSATFSAKRIASTGGPPPPPIPVFIATDDADFIEVTLSRLPL